MSAEPEAKTKIALLERLGFDDVQAVIALVLVVAFVGAVAYAISRTTTVDEIQGILQLIVTPVMMVLTFFFGKKAAE